MAHVCPSCDEEVSFLPVKDEDQEFFQCPECGGVFDSDEIEANDDDASK